MSYLLIRHPVPLCVKDKVSKGRQIRQKELLTWMPTKAAAAIPGAQQRVIRTVKFSIIDVRRVIIIEPYADGRLLVVDSRLVGEEVESVRIQATGACK
jgi:hypothetical protein